jgi:hypothetical protein
MPRYILFVRACSALALVACGTNEQTSSAPESDASIAADAGSNEALDATFGGNPLPAVDGSCDLGSAASAATPSSLDLFGEVAYIYDGGALPAGRYRATYIDGCMKYSTTGHPWTVNNSPDDAGPGTGGWHLVVPGTPSVGMDGGAGTISAAPGTVEVAKLPGTNLANGADTFAACELGNRIVNRPREFYFTGGKLGIWLRDYPYSDNVAGEGGKNPRWNITLLGSCPPPPR